MKLFNLISISLISFFLLGCSSDITNLPSPIKLTENKSKTIQLWLNDFSFNLYKHKDEQKYKNMLCEYQVGDFKNYINKKNKFDIKTNINNVLNDVVLNDVDTKIINNYMVYDYNKNKYDLIFDEELINRLIENQCDLSYDILKNKYLSFSEDNIIDEQEFKQLNTIYLEEHKKITNTFNDIFKQIIVDFIKVEKRYKEGLKKYQENIKNGMSVEVR